MEDKQFEKCDCGQKATWIYMPGYSSGCSPYFCDECVHRGCSCNEYSVVAEHYHPPGGISPDEEDGKEGVDWIWTNEEKTSWANIDSRGRRWPCCEYEFDEEGFEIEEDDHSDDEYLRLKSGEGRDHYDED
jgi:hypothetical protein